MIRAKNTDFEVQQIGEGDRVAMSIDDNALVHIMTMLTDLYSDPALAVIREYATNAHDSHIEAGNPSPIEITLPSQLAPFLKIKDYGVGLSAHDIAEIYSKYGATTKGATNDQQGVLGLGCKSALTYTNQFTLVGVKDGIRTMVVISRDEDDIGTMTIVDEVPTDQASGVEIIIPAKHPNDFLERVPAFFSWWAAGSVLINDQPPRYWTETIKGISQINDHVYLNTERKNIVVMGNVPYPIDRQYLDDKLTEHHGVIVFAPMAAVEFAPSREQLRYTKLTKAYLSGVMEEIRHELPILISKQIDDQPTPHEAAAVLLDWQAKVPLAFVPQPASYKGESIPEEFDFTNMRVTMSRRVSSKKSQHSAVLRTSLKVLADSVLVDDFGRTFTPNVKERLLAWQTQLGGPYPEYFILAPGHTAIDGVRWESPFDIKWVNPASRVSWTVVEAVKLPRYERTANSRIAGSYEAYVDGFFHREIEAKDIDLEAVICYGEPGIVRTYQDVLAACFDHSYAVYTPDHRKAKFIRLFPQARPIAEVVQECLQTWLDWLPARARQAMGVQRAPLQVLKQYRASRIDDPELRHSVEIAQYVDGDEYATLGKHQHVFQALYYRSSVDLRQAWRRYPLVTNYEKPTEHIYWYLNATYKRFYKGRVKHA